MSGRSEEQQQQQQAVSGNVTDWYRPGVSIKEFHDSPARVRALIGGRGCGKTTGVCMEAVTHGWHNAGARIFALRKTQAANTDTTQETLEMCFINCGSGYSQNGDYSLFRCIEGGRKYRIPSRLAVERYNEFMRTAPAKAAQQVWLNTVGDRLCSHILFAGLPHEGSRQTKFRGFECSMLIFTEADQLDRADLNMARGCLRWKGADPSVCDEKGYIRDTCIILDTNPPNKTHWIAKMEDEESGEQTRFWHIKTSENAHNLPDGYVEDLMKAYRNNFPMLNRMVFGNYDVDTEYPRVYYNFDSTNNVSNQELPWIKGAYLVRGWDFGLLNCVVYSAYFEHDGAEYWWDLFENYNENSDIEKQCLEVKKTMTAVFPFWNDRAVCSGIMDFCDVAGNQRTDKGSSVKVMRAHGFNPTFRTFRLPESNAVLNRLFMAKDKYGRSSYQISAKGCPKLYEASLGGYRYPAVGEPGYGSDEPGKGPRFGNFDHVADAARYAKCNLLKMAQESLGLKKHSGKLGRKQTPNRTKDY